MNSMSKDAKSLNEFLEDSETKKKALEKIIKGLDTKNNKNLNKK